MQRGTRRRLHRAAGRARGLRRHDDDARRRRPGEERLLDAVPEVSAGRSRGRARAADRGGAARRHGRRRRRLQTLFDFLRTEYLPGARATVRRLRPAQGPRVLRLHGPPVHDARPHARPGPRDRPRRRSCASAPRWTRVMAKTGFQGNFADVPEVPAHRPALLREDARGAAQGPRTSPSASTASCRRCSGPCRACRTASSPCPRTSRRSTPAAATSRRRPAARRRASTGSTRTPSTSGRSTSSRR